MSEQTLVEKVARAIATVESQGGWTAEVMDKLWDSYDMQAEFAIKAVFDAIAEPSDELLWAVYQADLATANTFEEFMTRCPGYRDDFRIILRAMVAVLRKEIES